MIRQSFNDGWEVRPKTGPLRERLGGATAFTPVTLPHDAMINGERVDPAHSDAWSGPSNGYFRGGVFEYRKQFHVAESLRGTHIELEFEGVFRGAMVYVNGVFAGQRPNGHVPFTVVIDEYLRFGAENTIVVESRAMLDSRWYSGAGIYRDVWLLVAAPVHIPVDGVSIQTTSLDGSSAAISVRTQVRTRLGEASTVSLRVDLRDASGVCVASQQQELVLDGAREAAIVCELSVEHAALWSDEAPNLYRCHVTLTEGDVAVDAHTESFGIRTLQVDGANGLRVNGTSVKLRGACVQLDHGVLGLAASATADRRRIARLKAAGFNAIRSVARPLGRTALEACDELGMYVIDEFSDVWTANRAPLDYALEFGEWWERDLEALVRHDRNHPSVIMYSIGNEIPELSTARAASIARQLADRVHSIDPTRPTTLAVNAALLVPAKLVPESTSTVTGAAATSLDMPSMLQRYVSTTQRLAISSEATLKSTDVFEAVDVAGMNYNEQRYMMDAAAFPDRVMVGTASYPSRAGYIWPLIANLPSVIGDFVWTGWDYLGEAGMGRPRYGTFMDGHDKVFVNYPFALAGCGDFDVTGHRRPSSYFREIVFGQRREPFVAIERPEYRGQPWVGSPWAWRDVVPSWTWWSSDGEPLTVHVYSDADEVELVVNGRTAGIQPCGAGRGFVAEFTVEYEPGEVVAIAVRDGEPAERMTLRTTEGSLLLHVRPDADVIETGTDAIAFIDIDLADASGSIDATADRDVHIALDGPGELIGFINAQLAGRQPLESVTRRTIDGHVLAIVRATGIGVITLTASATGCATVATTIRAIAPEES